jgi:hypothetical protein
MSNENLIKCHELVKAIRDKKVLLERTENNKLRITSIEDSTVTTETIRANLDVVTALLTGSKADGSYASIKRIRQAKASCPEVLDTGHSLPECLYCHDWYPWMKDGKPTGVCLSRRASGDTGILNGGERQ